MMMWRAHTHTHDKLGRAVEGRGYATMVKKLLWIEGSHVPFHQNNRKEQQRFINNKPKTFPMALKAFFFPTTDPTKLWGQGLRRTKTDQISLYLYLGTQLLSHPACDSWGSGVAWEFKGCKWWVWAGFMLSGCFRHGWIWWLPLCFKGFVGEVSKCLAYHREFTFTKGLVGVGTANW